MITEGIPAMEKAKRGHGVEATGGHGWVDRYLSRMLKEGLLEKVMV